MAFLDELNNRYLTSAGDGGYAKQAYQPVLDMSIGGAFGWSPLYGDWLSNQAYVPRNLICQVLRPPLFMYYMPKRDMWWAGFKNLFEVHARRWEGFNATLSANYDEHEFGGSNKQHEFVGATREQAVPSLNAVEKAGAPIEMMLEYWIRMGGVDPENRVSAAVTIPYTNFPEADRWLINTAAWGTCDAIFYEPDAAMENVIRAWVMTNMAPKTAGEVTGKRDITADFEIVERSIEWTGLPDYSLGSKVLAREMLKKLKFFDADPFTRGAFTTGPESEIAGVASGYKGSIDANYVGNLANTQI